MDHIKIRALQNVRRFNFEKCNRYQSVAEHSMLVAVLAMDACREVGVSLEVSFETIRAALLHDATEAITGDIPYLVRRKMNPDSLKNIENEARKELGMHFLEDDIDDPNSFGFIVSLVRLCDALELVLYLREEKESGNTTIGGILLETYSRIIKSNLMNKPAIYSWVCNVLREDDMTHIQSIMREIPTFLKH